MYFEKIKIYLNQFVRQALSQHEDCNYNLNKFKIFEIDKYDFDAVVKDMDPYTVSF